jgi:molybdenum cofactor biosynthesis enzyme MoaA
MKAADYFKLRLKLGFPPLLSSDNNDELIEEIHPLASTNPPTSVTISSVPPAQPLEEVLGSLASEWKQATNQFVDELKDNCGPLALWSITPQFKSVTPALLKAFWGFFGVRPTLRKLLLSILSNGRCAGSRDPNLPTLLFELELMLVDDQFQDCRKLGETITLRHSSDLRLQDVRARALMLCDIDPPRPIDVESACKPFHDSFCSSPFDSLAFFERDVFICCCNYLPSSVGSIRASDFDSLWNSDIAKAIRRSVLSGSFEYCNKMVCPRLRNNDLVKRTDATLAPYYKNIISTQAVSSPECYPRSIELNEDPSCNLTCPSCRKEKITGERPFLIDFENNILPDVLANPVNSFLVACFGEPFASRHYLRVLRSLDSERHRIGQLVLFTNGLLFTPALWASLHNLRRYDIEMRVSIDAASPETYKEVRRGGEWSTLQANLGFIRDLRASGAFYKLIFAFVTQRKNFQEMPQFVHMSKSFAADEVIFSEMQPFGEYDQNEPLYSQNAVHLQAHPEHRIYRRILQDPAMNDPSVSFHGRRLG